jgi:hypothetical protein
MPRDGSLTPGDLIGKLDWLRIPLSFGPFCGLLLLAIAVVIATHGKAQAQSEQCQVPDAPTKQGDCYMGSNPNPEGTLCTYLPYFFSPRFKLTRSGDDYLYPGAQHVRLICDRTDDTLEFYKWGLTDQKIR